MEIVDWSSRGWNVSLQIRIYSSAERIPRGLSSCVDGKVIKFHNILDRGYRGNVTAFRGDQLSLQPPSSRSDIRFTGKQTIHSDAVARDRTGNERGVRAMKRSGLFSSGFQPGMYVCSKI